jgi:hypothetical protein
MPGSRVDWEEVHRIKRFNGMLPPSPGAPRGAVEFIAVEGGTRILGLHEIVVVE